jgi:hypothetical protein
MGCFLRRDAHAAEMALDLLPHYSHPKVPIRVLATSEGCHRVRPVLISFLQTDFAEIVSVF